MALGILRQQLDESPGPLIWRELSSTGYGYTWVYQVFSLHWGECRIAAYMKKSGR